MREISEFDFIEIFKKDNQLAELMRIIQEIDRDHNGYVTSTEMDDILRILHPAQLEGINLKSLLKPFCSSANKVLLDYKMFRDFIRDGLEGLTRAKAKDLHSNRRNLQTGGHANPTQLRLEELKRRMREKEDAIKALE